MSATNWITFNCQNNGVRDSDVLDLFLKIGWVFDDENSSFLSENGDNFSWCTEHTDIREVKRIFDIRENDGKNNGIVLYWKGHCSRITVVLYRENSIFISVDSNDHILEGTRIADLSWYLGNILPIFTSKISFLSIEINVVP